MISLKDYDFSGYRFAIVIPCFNEAKRIDIDLLTQYIGLSELYQNSGVRQVKGEPDELQILAVDKILIEKRISCICLAAIMFALALPIVRSLQEGLMMPVG